MLHSRHPEPTLGGIEVSAATLIDRMLDPAVKLGTSTPQADPSGDYAWEVFRRVDKLRPGSFVALEAKALKLTGGPSSPHRRLTGASIASTWSGARPTSF